MHGKREMAFAPFDSTALNRIAVNFVSQLKDRAKKQRQPKQREFGVAKGCFVVSKDFDEPLEAVKEYMQWTCF